MMVKPFRFSNLKKVSKKEQSLIDGFHSLFPADVREHIGVEIRKVLLRHLGEKAFYYVDSLETAGFAECLGKISENSVLSLISAEPASIKIILQIDGNLSFALIDKLLGGAGLPSFETRPLTETEKGVIQYIIMQILATIYVACGKKAAIHFRFERFAQDALVLKGMMNDKEPVVVSAFKVGIGELSGFAKLVLPKSFINKSAVLEAQFDAGDFAKRIANFDYIRTTLWAEAGRVGVSQAELSSLEAGDVVVFDDTGIVLKESHIAGKAFLRVGAGESASLTAAVDSDNNKIKCIITGS